jgi:rubrerythrin
VTRAIQANKEAAIWEIQAREENVAKAKKAMEEEAARALERTTARAIQARKEEIRKMQVREEKLAKAKKAEERAARAKQARGNLVERQIWLCGYCNKPSQSYFHVNFAIGFAFINLIKCSLV